MSLLSRNQCLVTASLRSFAIAGRTVGIKTTLHQQSHLLLNDNTHTQPWQNFCDGLNDKLAEMSLQKNSELRIVLSSSLVRYLLLPAQKIVMNKLEKNQYVRAAYREIYGSLVEDWIIQCDDTAPNQSTLAAATDQKLIDTLLQISVKHGLKLTSVQPHFVASLNRLRTQLNSADSYLAVVEEEAIVIGTFVHGNLQGVKTVSYQGDWKLALTREMHRQSLFVEQSTDLQNGPIAITNHLKLYAPTFKKQALPVMENWILQRLDLRVAGIKDDTYHLMLEVML